MTTPTLPKLEPGEYLAVLNNNPEVRHYLKFDGSRWYSADERVILRLDLYTIHSIPALLAAAKERDAAQCRAGAASAGVAHWKAATQKAEKERDELLAQDKDNADGLHIAFVAGLSQAKDDFRRLEKERDELRVELVRAREENCANVATVQEYLDRAQAMAEVVEAARKLPAHVPDCYAFITSCEDVCDCGMRPMNEALAKLDAINQTEEK